MIQMKIHHVKQNAASETNRYSVYQLSVSLSHLYDIVSELMIDFFNCFWLNRSDSRMLYEALWVHF